YETYPHLPEGKLSKMRSSIVNEASLYQIALALGLDELILLGKGEYKEEGYLKPSLLSNLLEAILGGIFLDSGLEKAKNTLDRIAVIYQKKYGHELYSLDIATDFDAKSRLQELCLKRFKTLPVYEATLKENTKFDISLKINGHFLASLEDISKKKGMQKLAK